MFKTNSIIWYLSSFGIWNKGIILEKKNNKKCKIMDIYNSNIFDINIHNIKFSNDNDNVNNLSELVHLNEPSIINSIHIRYCNNKIYTYNGETLISINPYKNIEIYNNKFMNLFKNKKSNFPHIFDLINNCFQNLIENNKSQCMLVSGESGSGKTFTVRKIIKYLSYLSSNNILENSIENKVYISNNIIEAFGNSKTPRNNNSSRFGKYIKINFSDKNVIIGGNIETYLLEKSRLISEKDIEKNFHIFYLMLNGLKQDIKSKYFLKNHNDYKILNPNLLNNEKEKLKLKTQFNELIKSFIIFNFNNDDIDEIYKILSFILNLSNINSINNLKNNKFLLICSKLVNIDKNTIIDMLYFNTKIINNEKIKVKLNQKKFLYIKNTIIKVIYETLFKYIIHKINKNIYNQKINDNKFIGILDIFGFEEFEKDNFEQLCINYTNEKLQTFYNQYIFENEQKLYKSENLDWNDINYPNNKKNIFILNNIFNFVDEQCIIPGGNDNNLYNNIINIKSERLKIDFSHKKKKDFLFKHYASDVKYNVNNFCIKNKDKLTNNTILFLENLNFKFIKFIDKKFLYSLNNINSPSISNKFIKQLNDLLNHLNLLNPYFIRCIKPNDKDLPNCFIKNRVLQQLKYSGILETVKISRFGYPIRFNYKLFSIKYKLLLQKINNNLQKLNHFLPNLDFKLGKTKIFLKRNSYNELNLINNEILTKYVIKIQTFYRMYKNRKFYNKLRKNTIKIQSIFKKYITRKKYLIYIKNKNAIKIQCFFKKYLAIKKLKSLKLQKNNYIITNNFNNIINRNKYLKKINSIKKIQSFFKNKIYNKKFNKKLLSNKINKHKQKQKLEFEHKKLKNKIVEYENKIGEDQHTKLLLAYKINDLLIKCNNLENKIKIIDKKKIKNNKFFNIIKNMFH